MSRFVFVLFMVLALPLTLTAQDTPDDPPDLYITVQLDTRGGAPSEAQIDDFVNLMNALNDALTLQGINTAFFDLPPAIAPERLPFFQPADADLDVTSFTLPIMSVRYLNTETEAFINFTPFAQYTFPPLPIGAYTFAGSIQLDGDIVPETTDIITAMTAMGAYIAGDCAAALPLIDATLTNETIAQTATINLYDFRFALAACAYVSGDAEFTIATYEDMIDMMADDDSFYQFAIADTAINLAWVHAEQGDDQAALDTLDTYTLTTYENYVFLPPVTALEAVELYARLGAYDSAQAELDALLTYILTQYDDSRPSTLVAHLYTVRGQLYAATGEVDQAFAAYNTALDADPDYPTVYFFRAQLFSSEGMVNSAETNYQLFLDMVDAYLESPRRYPEDLTPYIEQAQKALDE